MHQRVKPICTKGEAEERYFYEYTRQAENSGNNGGGGALIYDAYVTKGTRNLFLEFSNFE